MEIEGVDDTRSFSSTPALNKSSVCGPLEATKYPTLTDHRPIIEPNGER